MRNYTRIEKSATHKGEYVGYCNGVWRIKKWGKEWMATKQDALNKIPSIYVDTLKQLQDKFDAMAKVTEGVDQ